MSLFIYLSYKDKKFFVYFIATAIINISLAIFLFVILLQNPSQIKIDLRFVVWIIAGIIAITLLGLKILIFTKIFLRTKDSNYYRKNFFDKKVYNKEIISNKEYMVLMLSIPLFLLTGSFFTAYMINMIIR